MKRVARIDSYFSLETDLAVVMSSWPEFVNGSGYSVTLKSPDEVVAISLHEAKDDDSRHVVVEGTGGGALFERALGAAVFAMSAHSDSVWVSRWGGHEA